MDTPEQQRLSEIYLHLEIEAVTRELSILDEAMHECSHRPLAAASFGRAKQELLRAPAAYLLKQAEVARTTWEHQPALAKYMYQENDTE